MVVQDICGEDGVDWSQWGRHLTWMSLIVLCFYCVIPYALRHCLPKIPSETSHVFLNTAALFHLLWLVIFLAHLPGCYVWLAVLAGPSVILVPIAYIATICKVIWGRDRKWLRADEKEKVQETIDKVHSQANLATFADFHLHGAKNATCDESNSSDDYQDFKCGFPDINTPGITRITVKYEFTADNEHSHNVLLHYGGYMPRHKHLAQCVGPKPWWMKERYLWLASGCLLYHPYCW